MAAIMAAIMVAIGSYYRKSYLFTPDSPEMRLVGTLGNGLPFPRELR